MARRADERRCYTRRHLQLIRSGGMPYPVPTESSSEITMLEQIITSVSDRLDGLAEDDPAAPPLREHLGELTARRDLLVRAQLDSSYQEKRREIWLFPLGGVMGGLALLGALTDLRGTRSVSLAGDVIGLVAGVFVLLVCVPLTFATWSDMREYRRTHAGERP
jgi:hypothetical protein